MADLEHIPPLRRAPGWRPIARRRCASRWPSEERHVLGRSHSPKFSSDAAARLVRAHARQGLDGAGTGRGNMAAAVSNPARRPRSCGRRWPRSGARQPLTSLGISMLGPALLKYGTEEQKKEHLPQDHARALIPLVPGLFRAECRLRSSPRCRRVPSIDGDHFIINGQKIWTSYANYADWIFCLVRTRSRREEA